MNTTKIFLTTCTFLYVCCTFAYAQAGYGESTLDSGYGASILALSTPTPTILTPTPAPAPGPTPEFVNLTELLTVAGPFSTFLKYLESTKLIETLQTQANDTEEGITLFVPKDTAFSNLKKPDSRITNLTSDQLKQLCLFHALPHYYSLSDFKNLSGVGPVNTMAGGSYTLNFTDESGTVHIGSGWTNTVVSSSVHAKDPVAIYQVNRVLLPEAIFGTDVPIPAPAPAPVAVTDVAPVADGPDDNGGKGKGEGLGSGASSFTVLSSSCGIIGWNGWRWVVVVTVSGGLMVVM